MRWTFFSVIAVLLVGCDEPNAQYTMPPPRIDPASLDMPGAGQLREELDIKNGEIDNLKLQLEVLHEALARAAGKSVGMVEWVDLDLKSAMVNRGSSDGAEIDLQFAVYGSDADLPNVGFRRGIVKVTKIVGPHLSEAVIVEVNEDLPVRAGDRVYDLSATGIGAIRKNPPKTPDTKVNEDTLKQLESAFEGTDPLKLPKIP